MDDYRRAGARRRRRAAARPRRARPRARRRPFRDGLSRPAEPAQRRRLPKPGRRRSSPTGKHVVVIGGGDTGSDCIGTANRQGAASVTQLEIMPEPPRARGQGAELAALADEAAHLLVAGGRRRRANSRSSPRAFRRARTGRRRRRCACEQRRRAASSSRPISSCSPWASPARRPTASSPGAGVDDRARQAGYATSRARHLRLRRHAPRPVAGRLGDPRRPRMRRRGRRLARRGAARGLIVSG